MKRRNLKAAQRIAQTGKGRVKRGVRREIILSSIRRHTLNQREISYLSVGLCSYKFAVKSNTISQIMKNRG